SGRGVARDWGEFAHVAPEGEMREEVRVLIEPGVESKAPLRRVDVELFVERIETDPVSVDVIDAFAAVDPEPAGSVVQRGAGQTERGGEDEIVRISGHRVPVRQRELL